MIHVLRRRLGRTWRLSATSASGVSAASATTEWPIRAYTDGCLISGRLQLDGERLADVLNAQDEIVLLDVQLERLEDGALAELPTFAVRRDELVAVRAEGPRGNPARRIRRYPHRVIVQSGPFRVRGDLHAFAGADAISGIRHGRPIVALTNATLEYECAGEAREETAETLLVNRDLMDSLDTAD